MNFNHIQLERWMQLIRTHPDGVECFWPSQIKAKSWLAEEVDYLIPQPSSCVIFGAWYGVLADMLQIEDTTVVELEQKCLNWCGERYNTWFGCMSEYQYENTPEIVINTVTEHVSQEVYDTWFDNIPKGTHYIIQGNNDFSLKDHVRATKDLDTFALRNNLDTNYIMLDEQAYEGPWDFENDKPNYLKRFMGIGKK
tara:strand:- start:1012 stop:1599 length:588 start_codon:yes stop_codon:yes gene_type:complete